jgi:hypothetical protein
VPPRETRQGIVRPKRGILLATHVGQQARHRCQRGTLVRGELMLRHGGLAPMVEKSKASSSAVQANEGNRLCCASYGSAKACNDHLSWSSEQARKFSLFGIKRPRN